MPIIVSGRLAVAVKARGRRDHVKFDNLFFAQAVMARVNEIHHVKLVGRSVRAGLSFHASVKWLLEAK